MATVPYSVDKVGKRGLQRVGHRVNPARMKRPALGEAFQPQPTAGRKAVAGNRFRHVMGTTGVEAAPRAQHRRHDVLIHPNEPEGECF